MMISLVVVPFLLLSHSFSLSFLFFIPHRHAKTDSFRRTILTSAICVLKEYFSKVVGPVKTCSLSYGPTGQSRGIATIMFVRSGDAENAALSYNNVLVDKRPMKVCCTLTIESIESQKAHADWLFRLNSCWSQRPPDWRLVLGTAHAHQKTQQLSN